MILLECARSCPYQELRLPSCCATITGVLVKLMMNGLLMRRRCGKLLVCWTSQWFIFLIQENLLVAYASNHFTKIRLLQLLVAILFVIHAGQVT
uniref:Uncharacterized protein n=1 Tax=Rhizophora mucronata TaxID=61149 RepID=A0A2P2LQM6_RHIMU